MGSDAVSRVPRRGQTILCLAIALAVSAVAAAGVFLRGDGSTAEAVSIRGETFRYALTGIYRYNAERVVAEGIGWDAVTLFVVLPAFLIGLPFLYRGSLKGRLFVLGMLAYFLYQYLEYSLFWAYGPLFLPFVAIYAASALAIVWIAAGSPDFKDLVMPSFPRKGMAGLCFAMSALLVLMWFGRIFSSMGGNVQGVLYGTTTLVVQSLDLGLLVPLMVLTGVLVLKRRSAGYVLSSVFIVKAVAMSAAIIAMLVSAWMTEGTFEAVPAAIFAAAAAASVYLGLRMYRSPASVEK